MRRKKYSEEFKQYLIQQVQKTGSIVKVGQQYGINEKTLGRWVREFKGNSGEKKSIEAKGTPVVPLSDEFQKVIEENEQLKKMLGERDLKIAILTNYLKSKPEYWKSFYNQK